MLADDANLQSLTGGLKLRVRIQHPGVHERTDRAGSYWYIRYWDDVLQLDGTVKPVRKFHTLGPSKGENRLTKKQAEVERDKFLAPFNKPSIAEKVGDGLAVLEKFVERFKAAHVEAEAGGRYLLKKPTREKYLLHLDQKILPQWGKKRLCEIKPDEGLQGDSFDFRRRHNRFSYRDKHRGQDIHHSGAPTNQGNSADGDGKAMVPEKRGSEDS